MKLQELQLKEWFSSVFVNRDFGFGILPLHIFTWHSVFLPEAPRNIVVEHFYFSPPLMKPLKWSTGNSLGETSMPAGWRNATWYVQLCLHSKSKKISYYTQSPSRSEPGELYLFKGYSTAIFLWSKIALGLFPQIEHLASSWDITVKLIQVFTVLKPF